MQLPVRRSLNPTENVPAWVATVSAIVGTFLARYVDAELAYALAGAAGLILGVVAQRFTFPWSDLLDHGDLAPGAFDAEPDPDPEAEVVADEP